MTDPRSTPSIPVAPEEPWTGEAIAHTLLDKPVTIRSGLLVSLMSWAMAAPTGEASCAARDRSVEEAREVIKAEASGEARPTPVEPEAPRHYPNDNCGDAEHDPILEEWYARANAMLDRLEAANAGLELNGIEEERDRLAGAPSEDEPR